MPKGHLPLVPLACLTLMITVCSVGLNYKRPEARVPSVYKEPLPVSFKEAAGWQVAQPNDGTAIVTGAQQSLNCSGALQNPSPVEAA